MTCLRSVDLCVANLCLYPMIVFENKFSAIISQSQQSTIASTSLRSPLDCCARSTLNASVTGMWSLYRFFCFGGSVSQSVASRVTCLRSVDVCSANLCLCQMIVFENKFSAIILQRQQSAIVSTSLRSPLGCCARSTLNASVTGMWSSCRLFFCVVGSVGQSVASRVTCLRSVDVCCCKSLSLSDDCL